MQYQQEKTQIEISERVRALAVSQTLAMSAKSQELKAQGVDVINLSVGEPDFNTPEHIKEAAKKAIDDNFTRYPPVAGYMDLRQAIARMLQGQNDPFEAEQVVVAGGAKAALANVILSTINPGDEVVLPVPAWVSYVEMVKLAGGVTVAVETPIEQDFKITPAQLEGAITERTRMLVLCSPSNPTGAVYTRAELQALIEVLLRHPRVMVLSDEIYCEILYGEPYSSLGSFPELRERVVVINGVSKAYAMTGWRVGFMAGPLNVAKAVSKLQSQTSSGICTIAQKAAVAAYNGSQQCVADMVRAFRRRRDLIVGLARQIPGIRLNEPQGAFYIFPDVRAFLGRSYTGADGSTVTVKTDSDLAMYLLEHAHVASVAGSAFLLPGFLRFSYAAADEQLRQAMARVKDALALLK